MNDNKTIDAGLEKIDAIRDIIFGQNIEEYDRMLEHINIELKKIKLEHSANLKELQNVFNKQVHSLESKLDTQFKEQQSIIYSKLKTLSNTIEQKDKKSDKSIFIYRLNLWWNWIYFYWRCFYA